MAVVVYPYIAGSGRLLVSICYAPHGAKAHAGMPGTKSLLLDEISARDMLLQLTRALAAPPECIDCGSTLHTVDDPSCPVSNAGERDAD